MRFDFNHNKLRHYLLEKKYLFNRQSNVLFLTWFKQDLKKKDLSLSVYYLKVFPAFILIYNKKYFSGFSFIMCTNLLK